MEGAAHCDAYFLDRGAYCERVALSSSSISRGPGVAVQIDPERT